jgi:ParB family chromosome partitioning protein
MLGQTENPAVVIEASESECLVMSLVENIARRIPRPIDLMKEIGALRSRGYSDAEIAEKIGVGASWVNMIASLLERGEERLVASGRNRAYPDYAGDGDFQGRDGGGAESTPRRL